jgi:hypothetical protein
MLNNYLRKFAIENNGPTITNGYLQFNAQMQDAGKNLPYVFIFPDIGASTIYATWNQQNSNNYLKQLDAYGNYETTDKWKCREVQNNFTKIWYPFEKSGDALACWSDIAKTVIDTDKLSNNPKSVVTKTDEKITGFCNPVEAGKEPYDVLVRALYTLGYREDSNQFVVNYDFRRILKDIYRVLNYVNTKASNRPVIFISHGLGSLIANYCIQNNPGLNLKAYVTFGPTIGGIPKALKTLVSGETSLPQGKVIRSTSKAYDGLYLMLPISDLYSTDLFMVSSKSYNKDSVVPFVSSVFGDNIPDMEKISQFIRTASKAPPMGVKTFILGGTGFATESNYIYNYNDYDNPKIVSRFNGDGTVPIDLVQELFNKWSLNNFNIKFKFYNADHVTLLMKYEPIKDFIDFMLEIIG